VRAGVSVARDQPIYGPALDLDIQIPHKFARQASTPGPLAFGYHWVFWLHTSYFQRKFGEDRIFSAGNTPVGSANPVEGQRLTASQDLLGKFRGINRKIVGCLVLV
jgi:hypothetical protein